MKRYSFIQSADPKELDSVIKKAQNSKKNISEKITKKPTNLSFKSLSSKTDCRLGVLYGMVMFSKDNSKKPKVSNMSSVSGAGVRAPVFLLNIIDLENLDLDFSKTKLTVGNETTDPTEVQLFQRNFDNSVSFCYAMNGVAQVGEKAKLWKTHAIPEGVSFSLSNGSTVWGTAWNENSETFKVGDIVKLSNVKLSSVASENPKLQNVPKLKYSDYFFNCDVIASDAYDWCCSLPTHAKLRYFWQPRLQLLPGTHDLAKTNYRVTNNVSAYAKTGDLVDRLLAKMDSNLPETERLTPEMVDGMIPKRVLDAKCGKTYLACFCGNGFFPTCDEYDPVYLKALGESIPDFYKTAADANAMETPDAIDIYSKTGSSIDLNWPESEEELVQTPAKGSEQYFKWEMSFTSVSWGTLGWENDPNYVSPMEFDSIDTEKCRVSKKNADGSEVVFFYNFKKTVGLIKIYGNKVLLGPTDPTSMAKLLISHQISFDILMEVDFEETKKLMSYQREESRYNKLQSQKSTKTESKSFSKNEKERKMCKKIALEKSRWISPSEAGGMDKLALVADFQKRDKDGIIFYSLKIISWRLSDYLEGGDGIKLSQNLMSRIYSLLPQPKMDQGSISYLDTPSIINPAFSYVYLNDKKVSFDLLSNGDYCFYALVCYGTEFGKNENVQKNNREKLQKFTELSKKEDETNDVALMEYLNEVDALVFYYAVNIKTTSACRNLAKQKYLTTSANIKKNRNRFDRAENLEDEKQVAAREDANAITELPSESSVRPEEKRYRKGASAASESNSAKQKHQKRSKPTLKRSRQTSGVDSTIGEVDEKL